MLISDRDYVNCTQPYHVWSIAKESDLAIRIVSSHCY